MTIIISQGKPLGDKAPWELGVELGSCQLHKDPHTRIKPLALGRGHGRCITVTPKRALVSVVKWPLNITVIHFVTVPIPNQILDPEARRQPGS